MGPYLFLSLFMLLLAFFILLNALATFETHRAQAVMRSVQNTFQSRLEPDLRAEVLVPTLGVDPEPEAVTEELERIWLTAFPLATVDRLQPGNTFQLTMRFSDVFEPDSADLRPDRVALMRATATVLANRPEGYLTQVQVLLGITRLGQRVGGDLSTPVPQEPFEFSDGAYTPEDVLRRLDSAGANAGVPTPRPGDLAFERAVTMANVLLGGGAPPDALSVGVKEGDERDLKLRFFLRPLAESFVTFAPARDGAQP